MERFGHPHQNITVRHHPNGAVSQVFEGDTMIQHFAGQNAMQEARRHANVYAAHAMQYKGNPNGDEYSSQF